MGSVHTATFEGKSFEAEIIPDGDLVFVDGDIEYEIAFVAMGGDETPATKLLKAWRKDPIDVICNNLGLEDDTLRLLAADWAEHVLPIFEHKYPEDHQPRLAIEATRDFVAGKITAAQLGKAREAAGAAAAARAAAAGAAYRARQAATAPAREQTWQVRHFVHVMERLQAGKIWPKIEETP